MSTMYNIREINELDAICSHSRDWFTYPVARNRVHAHVDSVSSGANVVEECPVGATDARAASCTDRLCRIGHSPAQLGMMYCSR